VIALTQQQAKRRAKLEAQAALLRDQQREERAQLAAKQKAARQRLRIEYLAQVRRSRIERAQRAPKGLAAFLGRVTGVTLITKKVQRYRDRKRFEAHLADRRNLAAQQREQQHALVCRHELQGADMQRKLRALDQIEERERKGLEQARTKERRQRINARHEHMPAFTLELKPPGRKAAPHKAKNRYISPLARELAEAARERQESKKIRLADEFTRAAREESGEGESGGSASGGPQPAAEPKIERQNSRKIDLSREFNEAAANPDDAGGDGGLARKPRDDGPDNNGPGNNRPRRKRRRDFDRGM